MEAEHVLIEYIGKKPVKRDTICNSGIIWAGHGDVQSVTVKIASLLLQHPNVWRRAAGANPVVTPQSINLQQFDDEDRTPQGESHGLVQASVVADESQEPESLETGEEAESLGDDEPKLETLVDLLRSLPNDAEHMSKHGKPIIGKVRELSGNPALTTQEVAAAWAEIHG